MDSTSEVAIPSRAMIRLRKRLEDPVYLAHRLFLILSSNGVKRLLTSKGMLLVRIEVLWVSKFSSFRIEMGVYKDGLFHVCTKMVDLRVFHHFIRRCNFVHELNHEFQSLLEVHLTSFIKSWERGK